jgi:hypothetical protein
LHCYATSICHHYTVAEHTPCGKACNLDVSNDSHICGPKSHHTSAAVSCLQPPPHLCSQPTCDPENPPLPGPIYDTVCRECAVFCCLSVHSHKPADHGMRVDFHVCLYRCYENLLGCVRCDCGYAVTGNSCSLTESPGCPGLCATAAAVSQDMANQTGLLETVMDWSHYTVSLCLAVCRHPVF